MPSLPTCTVPTRHHIRNCLLWADCLRHRTVKSNEVVLTWRTECFGRHLRRWQYLRTIVFSRCAGSRTDTSILDLRFGPAARVSRAHCPWSVEHVSFRSDGRQVAFGVSGRSRGLGPGQRHLCLEYEGPMRHQVVGVVFLHRRALSRAWKRLIVVCWMPNLVRQSSDGREPSFVLTQSNLAWATDETRLLTCDWTALYTSGTWPRKDIEAGRPALSFQDQESHEVLPVSSQATGALLRTTRLLHNSLSIARHGSSRLRAALSGDMVDVREMAGFWGFDRER